MKAAIKALGHKTKLTLEMIAFSHSLFAMPFALASYSLAHAQNQLPFSLKTLILVLLAMITARNSAMTFNRFTDRNIDALNPRTRDRHLPSGRLSPHFALIFTLINALTFILISYFINKLSFYLSPIALMIILTYSLSKRFTATAHLILGLSLGIAPVGAWIAVTGRIDLLPMGLGLGVLCWVAGFDILYSLQDEGFDRQTGLHSLTVRLGIPKAIAISRLLHASAVFVWLSLYLRYALGPFYLAGVLFMALFLAWEHRLVKANDLSRLDRAFFTANAIGSIGFLTGCLLKTLISR